MVLRFSAVAGWLSLATRSPPGALRRIRWKAALRGDVRLRSTQARYALPGVIRRFTQRYPDVQLSLRQGTPGDVSYLVASGAADLSIKALVAQAANQAKVALVA